MGIAVVINYCTNDYRFLAKAIEGVRPVASSITIPVADHFFDGKKEDRKLLDRSYREHPDCHFVEFAFDDKVPPGVYCPVQKGGEDWIHFWHSMSRYVGYNSVPAGAEYVLFIDVDEIFDGMRFTTWLDQFPYREYAALKFATYFYFRSAANRALSFQSNGLMVKKELIEPQDLIDIYERKGVFTGLPGPKLDYVCGLDGAPLCHHYSWVRTYDELLRKVVSWGHYKDKDWQTLLAEEFRQPFCGKDHLFGLSYEQVVPYWDPLL